MDQLEKMIQVVRWLLIIFHYQECHCNGNDRAEELYKELSEKISEMSKLVNQLIASPPTNPEYHKSPMPLEVVQASFESSMPTPISGTPKAVSILNLHEFYSEGSSENDKN